MSVFVRSSAQKTYNVAMVGMCNVHGEFSSTVQTQEIIDSLPITRKRMYKYCTYIQIFR